jgi:hypothetical protein
MALIDWASLVSQSLLLPMSHTLLTLFTPQHMISLWKISLEAFLQPYVITAREWIRESLNKIYDSNTQSMQIPNNVQEFIVSNLIKLNPLLQWLNTHLFHFSTTHHNSIPRYVFAVAVPAIGFVATALLDQFGVDPQSIQQALFIARQAFDPGMLLSAIRGDYLDLFYRSNFLMAGVVQNLSRFINRMTAQGGSGGEVSSETVANIVEIMRLRNQETWYAFTDQVRQELGDNELLESEIESLLAEAIRGQVDDSESNRVRQIFQDWTSDPNKPELVPMVSNALLINDPARAYLKHIKLYPQALEYVDPTTNRSMVSLEHFVNAQNRLRYKRLQGTELAEVMKLLDMDVRKYAADSQIETIQIDFDGQKVTVDSRKVYADIYEQLIVNGYSARLVNAINGDDYQDPELVKVILAQNPTPWQQSFYEAITNSYDAFLSLLGKDRGVGQFSRGIKQAIAWLEEPGDSVRQYSMQTVNGVVHAYEQIITLDDAGQWYINLRQIPESEWLNYFYPWQSEVGRGTTTEVIVKRAIPESDDLSDAAQVTQADLIETMSWKFSYIPEVLLEREWVGKTSVERVNGFEKKQVIVGKTDEYSVGTGGRRILATVHEHGWRVADNGSGMDAQILSRVFAPGLGTKIETEAAVVSIESQLTNLRAVIDETRPEGEVVFSRAREGQEKIIVDQASYAPQSFLPHGLLIDIPFAKVTDARDGILVTDAMVVALKELVATNRMQGLNPVQKIQYYNTLVEALRQLVDGNPKETELINAFVTHLKEEISRQGILAELRRNGSLLLPYQKGFASLRAVEVSQDKAIFVHQELLDWTIGDVKSLGGDEVAGVKVGMEYDHRNQPKTWTGKQVVWLPFSQNATAATNAMRLDWYALNASERIPMFETQDFVVVEEGMGKRIGELVLKRQRQGLSSNEQSELEALSQLLTISLSDTELAEGLNTNYRMPGQEVRSAVTLLSAENVVISGVDLDTSEANSFLAKPPSVGAKSPPAIPIDAQMYYFLDEDGYVLDVRTKIILFEHVDEWRFLGNGMYYLRRGPSEEIYYIDPVNDRDPEPVFFSDGGRKIAFSADGNWAYIKYEHIMLLDILHLPSRKLDRVDINSDTEIVSLNGDTLVLREPSPLDESDSAKFLTHSFDQFEVFRIYSPKVSVSDFAEVATVQEADGSVSLLDLRNGSWIENMSHKDYIITDPTGIFSLGIIEEQIENLYFHHSGGEAEINDLLFNVDRYWHRGNAYVAVTDVFSSGPTWYNEKGSEIEKPTDLQDSLVTEYRGKSAKNAKGFRDLVEQFSGLNSEYEYSYEPSFLLPDFDLVTLEDGESAIDIRDRLFFQLRPGFTIKGYFRDSQDPEHNNRVFFSSGGKHYISVHDTDAKPLAFLNDEFAVEHVIPTNSYRIYYVKNPTDFITVLPGKAVNFSQIHFDGKYLIFVDPLDGKVVYINPHEDQSTIALANSSVRGSEGGLPDISQRFALNARGEIFSFESGTVIEVNTEELGVSTFEELRFLGNNHYYLRKGAMWFVVIIEDRRFEVKYSYQGDQFKLSPDKQWLYIFDPDYSTVEGLYHLPTRTNHDYEFGYRIRQPQYTENGQFLVSKIYTNNPNVHSLLVADLQGDEPRQHNFPIDVKDFSVSPWANAVVYEDEFGTYGLIDLERGEEVEEFRDMDLIYTDASGIFSLGIRDEKIATLYFHGSKQTTNSLDIGSVRVDREDSGNYVVGVRDKAGFTAFFNSLGMRYAAHTSSSNSVYTIYGSKILIVYRHVNGATDEALALQAINTDNTFEQFSYVHPHLDLVVDRYPQTIDKVIEIDSGSVYEIPKGGRVLAHFIAENKIIYSRGDEYVVHDGLAETPLNDAVMLDGDNGRYLLRRLDNGSYSLTDLLQSPDPNGTVIFTDAAYSNYSFDGKFIMFVNPNTNEVTFVDPLKIDFSRTVDVSGIARDASNKEFASGIYNAPPVGMSPGYVRYDAPDRRKLVFGEGTGKVSEPFGPEATIEQLSETSWLVKAYRDDSTVQIYSYDTVSDKAKLSAYSGSVIEHKNGMVVLKRDDGTYHLVNSNGDIAGVFIGEELCTLSASGRYAISKTSSGKYFVYDLHAKDDASKFTFLRGNITEVTASPQADVVIVSYTDGEQGLIVLGKVNESGSYNPSLTKAVEVDSTGTIAILKNNGDSLFSVMNLHDNGSYLSKSVEGLNVGKSADGKYVLVAFVDEEDFVKISIDITTGKIVGDSRLGTYEDTQIAPLFERYANGSKSIERIINEYGELDTVIEKPLGAPEIAHVMGNWVVTFENAFPGRPWKLTNYYNERASNSYRASEFPQRLGMGNVLYTKSDKIIYFEKDNGTYNVGGDQLVRGGNFLAFSDGHEVRLYSESGKATSIPETNGYNITGYLDGFFLLAHTDGRVAWVNPQEFFAALNADDATADNESLNREISAWNALVRGDGASTGKLAWVQQARQVWGSLAQAVEGIMPGEFSEAAHEIRLALKTTNAQGKNYLQREYAIQEEAVLEQFTQGIQRGQNPDLHDLPFDRLQARASVLSQMLSAHDQFIPAEISRANRSAQIKYYRQLLAHSMELLLHDELDVRSLTQEDLIVFGLGLKPKNQEMLDAADSVIAFYRSAIAMGLPFEQVERFISLVVLSMDQSTQQLAVTLGQLERLSALTQDKNNQRAGALLSKIMQSLANEDMATLEKYVVSKHWSGDDLNEAKSALTYITEEVDELLEVTYQSFDGSDDYNQLDHYAEFAGEELIQGEGLFSSQIEEINRQLRLESGQRHSRVAAMELFDQALRGQAIPQRDEAMTTKDGEYGQKVEQAEAGAHTREAAQNTQDILAGRQGALNVRMYVRRDLEGNREFVEEIWETGGLGADQELALLIEASTKSEGDQLEMFRGFFGKGKFTMFEGVDRVELINNNGQRAYHMNFEVVRREGKVVGIQLVSLKKVSPQALQAMPMGVTWRRIKDAASTLPELEQMIAKKTWKTFVGMAATENFDLNWYEADGTSKPLALSKKRLIGELQMVEMHEGNYRPMIQIWETADMPLQIIDGANYRVDGVNIQDDLFALIDPRYRKYLKEWNVQLRFTMKLTGSRMGFEAENVAVMQKYVALAFYQALAHKTRIDRSPTFTPEGMPDDFRFTSNVNYILSLLRSDANAVRSIAERINGSELVSEIQYIAQTVKSLDEALEYVDGSSMASKPQMRLFMRELFASTTNIRGNATIGLNLDEETIRQWLQASITSDDLHKMFKTDAFTAEDIDTTQFVIMLLVMLRTPDDFANQEDSISIVEERLAAYAAEQKMMREAGLVSRRSLNNAQNSLKNRGELAYLQQQKTREERKDWQAKHIDNYIVEPRNAQEQLLLDLAKTVVESLTRENGERILHQVKLVSSKPGDSLVFGGLFMVKDGQRTMFLNTSPSQSSSSVQADTIIHELAHLLEELYRRRNQDSLDKIFAEGYADVAAGYTHTSRGGMFDAAMHYVSTIMLRNGMVTVHFSKPTVFDSSNQHENLITFGGFAPIMLGLSLLAAPLQTITGLGLVGLGVFSFHKWIAPYVAAHLPQSFVSRMILEADNGIVSRYDQWTQTMRKFVTNRFTPSEQPFGEQLSELVRSKGDSQKSMALLARPGGERLAMLLNHLSEIEAQSSEQQKELLKQYILTIENLNYEEFLSEFAVFLQVYDFAAARTSLISNLKIQRPLIFSEADYAQAKQMLPLGSGDFNDRALDYLGIDTVQNWLTLKIMRRLQRLYTPNSQEDLNDSINEFEGLIPYPTQILQQPNDTQSPDDSESDHVIAQKTKVNRFKQTAIACFVRGNSKSKMPNEGTCPKWIAVVMDSLMYGVVYGFGFIIITRIRDEIKNIQKNLTSCVMGWREKGYLWMQKALGNEENMRAHMNTCFPSCRSTMGEQQTVILNWSASQGLDRKSQVCSSPATYCWDSNTSVSIDAKGIVIDRNVCTGDSCDFRYGVCNEEITDAQKYNHNNYYSCDEQGNVYMSLAHTNKSFMVGRCNPNRSCVDGRCVLQDSYTGDGEVVDRSFWGETLLQRAEKYGVEFEDVDHNWTEAEIELVLDTCESLPSFMCSNVLFLRKMKHDSGTEVCAYSEEQSGTITIGHCLSNVTIVHELLHIQKSMYGVDITNADYSRSKLKYENREVNERYVLNAEFTAATGWVQSSIDRSFALFRDQKLVSENDEDLFYTVEGYPKMGEGYGIENQLTEHSAVLGQYYYAHSYELRQQDQVVYDFFRTHFFDGREYFRGVCGRFAESGVFTAGEGCGE